LADLHIDAVTNQATLQKIIERTNTLQADLIVIAGDMVDGTIEQRGQLAGLLQKLHAPLGVYAVSGNHDCYSGYEDWMKFFADNHIVMLENKFIRLPNDIVLVGISDPAIRTTGHFTDGNPRPCRDTDFSVQKSVSADRLPAISAKPARDTCFFSPKGVSRDRHRINRPLQTQNPSKVYPKTIIPHLSTDTSAVSKPTNVQGDGEISVRKTFRQGRLCKFSQTSYKSSI
jgi:hypothetical protein